MSGYWACLICSIRIFRPSRIFCCVCPTVSCVGGQTPEAPIPGREGVSCPKDGVERGVDEAEEVVGGDDAEKAGWGDDRGGGTATTAVGAPATGAEAGAAGEGEAAIGWTGGIPAAELLRGAGAAGGSARFFALSSSITTTLSSPLKKTMLLAAISPRVYPLRTSPFFRTVCRLPLPGVEYGAFLSSMKAILPSSVIRVPCR